MKKYFEAENDTIPTKHFPMVLYFTATWCGPCKTISPIFEKLAEENLERNKTLHNQTATNKRSQDNSKSRTFIYSKNNSDISKNWTKQSKPSFQCTKCSYKWNRDPLAKCAWCNEFGPYEKHNQILFS